MILIFLNFIIKLGIVLMFFIISVFIANADRVQVVNPSSSISSSAHSENDLRSSSISEEEHVDVEISHEKLLEEAAKYKLEAFNPLPTISESVLYNNDSRSAVHRIPFNVWGLVSTFLSFEDKITMLKINRNCYLGLTETFNKITAIEAFEHQLKGNRKRCNDYIQSLRKEDEENESIGRSILEAMKIDYESFMRYVKRHYDEYDNSYLTLGDIDIPNPKKAKRLFKLLRYQALDNNNQDEYRVAEAVLRLTNRSLTSSNAFYLTNNHWALDAEISDFIGKLNKKQLEIPVASLAFKNELNSNHRDLLNDLILVRVSRSNTNFYTKYYTDSDQFPDGKENGGDKFFVVHNNN